MIEQSLLGCCLRSGMVLGCVQEQIKAEDFEFELHQNIFKSLICLMTKSSNYDEVLAIEQLLRDKVCNHETISELLSRPGNSARVQDYIKLIKESSATRVCANALFEASNVIKNKGELSTSEIISDVMDELYACSQRLTNKAGSLSTEEAIANIILDYRERAKCQFYDCIQTGFNQLDEIIGGFQKASLVIVAAKTGVGKTVFALNVFKEIVFRYGRTAAFFSLEMNKQDLLERVTSNLGNINYSALKKGKLSEADVQRLVSTSIKLQESAIKMRVYDRVTPKVSSMRQLIIRDNMERPVDVIIVDYLQLLKSDSKSNSKYEEVTNISRDLKLLAMELNVPIIALSQFNRQSASRVDKTPVLSDLRDSGSIEQDADVIIFIDRPCDHGQSKETATITVAKNRRGAISSFDCEFDGSRMKFHEPKNFNGNWVQA